MPNAEHRDSRPATDSSKTPLQTLSREEERNAPTPESDARDIRVVPEALWTTHDIARYLNVAEATIRYWVHMKQIPFCKLQGKHPGKPHGKLQGTVRFQPSTIRKWVEESENRPAA